MTVFRVEKTKDFTVMSNHHLRNKTLSLKAKGLLSLMLSLPEDWDYTTKGLVQICKEGVDSISTALKAFINLSALGTDYKAGASQPSGTAMRLMQIFETAPEIVSKIAGESKSRMLGRNRRKRDISK